MKSKQNSSKSETVHLVQYEFEMRFCPPSIPSPAKQDQAHKTSTRQTWVQYLKSILPSKQPANSRELSNTVKNAQQPKDNFHQQQCQIGLKHILRLSSQHVLIGNQKQLDLFHVAAEGTKGVEMVYLWSIKRPAPMNIVTVEPKKHNMLMVVAGAEILVYKYDFKKLSSTPLEPARQTKLQDEPIFAEIFKEDHICLFYATSMEVYVLNDGLRRKFKANYQFPKELVDQGSVFTIFKLSETDHDGINVIFKETQSKGQEQLFTLWNLQIELAANNIKINSFLKIYENKKLLSDRIKISNYSGNTFLVSNINEILALRKGYLVDCANVNLKSEFSLLEYIGENILVHLSEKKIEIYNFFIDFNAKPVRINVKSNDSMTISRPKPNFRFKKTLKILENQFMFISELDSKSSKYRNGELRYQVYITKKLSKDKKLDLIFPSFVENVKIGSQALNEKLDIAEKMGFSTSQIYIKLWHNELEAAPRPKDPNDMKYDYSFLIATGDYATIKHEVVKILKKNSMLLTEVEKIENAAFSMLHMKVFSMACSYDLLIDYISSHLFRRKLQMLIEIKIEERKLKQRQQLRAAQTQGNTPRFKSATNIQTKEYYLISIREYQQLSDMNIKNQLLVEVQRFCFESDTLAATRIRIMLVKFKFAYRVIYFSLLEEIVRAASDKIQYLLENIPEILPYVDYSANGKVVHGGIWIELTPNEENQNRLTVSDIMTIDNKQIVENRLLKCSTFQRNKLWQHDLITLDKTTMNSLFAGLKSAAIYYFFISKLFQYIKVREDRHEEVEVNAYKTEETLNEIFDFLESKYQGSSRGSTNQDEFDGSQILYFLINTHMESGSLLPCFPANIKGQVMLYKKLYDYLQAKGILPHREGRPCQLEEFLDLTSVELFKHFFEKQKSIKGILLGDILNIYTEALPFNHKKIFNESLLNYFKSKQSQVSDLKYILNRINSEKRPFHELHQEMYRVLVEAIQHKLAIGSDNDVPIEEILVYMESIPLSLDEKSIGKYNTSARMELETISNLREYVELLRQARINMSIYDIINNYDEVYEKLVNYFFVQSQEGQLAWKSLQAFKQHAKKSLIEIEKLAQKIHQPRVLDKGQKNEYKTIIYFMLMCTICTDEKGVELPNYSDYALCLANDKYFKEKYPDMNMKYLVSYMYKKLMTEFNRFGEIQEQIDELLKLLDENEPYKRYVRNELNFATIMSCPGYPVTYPISQGVIDIKVVQNLLNKLKLDDPKVQKFILEQKLEEVYCVVKDMQDDAKVEAEDLAQQGGVVNPITQRQVYEVFLIKVLQLKSWKKKESIKKAEEIIQKLLGLQVDRRAFKHNSIYPILFFMAIYEEINEIEKQNLMQCVWFYFYRPNQLFEIMTRVTSAMTQHQRKLYIDENLESGKRKYFSHLETDPIQSFLPHHQIYNQEYLKVANSSPEKKRKFFEILYSAGKKIQGLKEQYRQVRYAMIYTIICNSPYSLCEFNLFANEAEVKVIKQFVIKTVVEQQFFEAEPLIEIMKRVFLANLTRLIEEHVSGETKSIVELQQLPLDEDYDIEGCQKFKEDDKSMEAYYDGYRAFKRYLSRRQKFPQLRQRDIGQIQNLFRGQEYRINFPSTKNIDQADSDQEGPQVMSIFPLKKASKFEAKTERQELFKSIRSNKSYNLYKSIRKNSFSSSNSKLTASIRKNQLSKTQYPGSLEPLLCLKQQSHSELEGDHSLLADSPKQILTPLPRKPEPLYQGQIITGQRANTIQSEEYQSSEGEGNDTAAHVLGEEAKANTPYNVPNANNKSNMCLAESFDYFSDADSSSKNNQQKNNQQKILQLIPGTLVDSGQLKQQVSLGKGLPQEAIRITVTKPILSAPEAMQMLIEANEKFLSGLYEQPQVKCFADVQIKPDALKQLVELLYQAGSQRTPVSKLIALIRKIVQSEGLEISHQVLDFCARACQICTRHIKDLKYWDVVTPDILFVPDFSEAAIFQRLHRNLQKYIEIENVWTFTRFISKIFDNQDYEQVLMWDLVMSMCTSLPQDTDVETRLVEIEAVLGKISVRLWNQNFQQFDRAVLQSELIDRLLELFCGRILQQPNKAEGLSFLARVQDIYDCLVVSDTLAQMEAPYNI